MSALPELLPIEQQGYSHLGKSELNIPVKRDQSVFTQQLDQGVSINVSESLDYVTIMKNQQLEVLLKEMQEIIAAQQEEIAALKHALAEKQSEFLNAGVGISSKTPITSTNSFSDSITSTRSSKIDEFKTSRNFLNVQCSPSLSPSERSSNRLPLPLPSPELLLEDEYSSISSSFTDKTTAEREGRNGKKHIRDSSKYYDAIQSLKLESIEDKPGFQTFLERQSKEFLRNDTFDQVICTESNVGYAESCPSPTKSMLLSQRDQLEEELLLQYQRMRKLEEFSQLNTL